MNDQEHDRLLNDALQLIERMRAHINALESFNRELRDVARGQQQALKSAIGVAKTAADRLEAANDPC